MKKSLSHVGLLLMLACAPCARSAAPAPFDAEKFFAANFMVDGLGTYIEEQRGAKSFPYPSAEGPWDFKALKRETGCNMIVMSYLTQASFEAQSDRFKKGQYHNARLIRTFADIKDVKEKGVFGVMMYVQSPYPLGGGIQNLKKFHEHGLRIFQLAYGKTQTDQAPGDVLGYGNDQEGGVTPLGEKVIAELNRLGMLVDISHCNEQTTLDACRLSKAPVICTHAAARAVTDRDRNKSDKALQAIAATGGVVGVTAVGWMIENAQTRERGVKEFCDHVDHIKQVIGVDHVSIASDGPLRGWDRLSPHYTSPELSDVGRWKTVATELHNRGWSDEDLKKVLGLNLVNLFRQVLKS